METRTSVNTHLNASCEPRMKMLADRHQVTNPLEVSTNLLKIMSTRRSIRSFSSRPVAPEILENAVKTAASAPSGANRQPWFFAIIQNAELKKQIREAAEKVELEFYNEKASSTWLEDLKPFGTNHEKAYLTDASALIAVFSRTCIDNESSPDTRLRTYYPIESTGIATGFLISALHQSGIATLTHTPKPMYFLNQILDLDKTYRPFMIIVAGHPKESTQVPDIQRKSFNEIAKIT